MSYSKLKLIIYKYRIMPTPTEDNYTEKQQIIMDEIRMRLLKVNLMSNDYMYSNSYIGYIIENSKLIQNNRLYVNAELSKETWQQCKSVIDHNEKLRLLSISTNKNLEILEWIKKIDIGNTKLITINNKQKLIIDEDCDMIYLQVIANSKYASGLFNDFSQCDYPTIFMLILKLMTLGYDFSIIEKITKEARTNSDTYTKAYKDYSLVKILINILNNNN